MKFFPMCKILRVWKIQNCMLRCYLHTKKHFYVRNKLSIIVLTCALIPRRINMCYAFELNIVSREGIVNGR